MAARFATIQTASTVQWSDGTAFDGYLFMELGYPTSASVAWPTVAIGQRFPNETLPRRVVIPIKSGTVQSDPRVPLNPDIVPPGSRHYAYWYDANLKLVAPTAGTATVINVNSETFTVTPPTLTVPTTSATSPNVLQTSYAEDRS